MGPIEGREGHMTEPWNEGLCIRRPRLGGRQDQHKDVYLLVGVGALCSFAHSDRLKAGTYGRTTCSSSAAVHSIMQCKHSFLSITTLAFSTEGP